MNGNQLNSKLTSMPWQYLEIGGRDFIMKFLSTDSNYELLLCDFVLMWIEKLDEEQLLARNNMLNPDIEISSNALVRHIQQMMNNKEATPACHVICLKDDCLIISSQTSLSNLLLKWEFHLQGVHHTMFANELTRPLIAMVGELVRRHQQLVDILKNKDAQIEDYKAEGIKLMRRHKADIPFNEQDFLNEMTSSKEFESVVKRPCLSAFSPDVNSLYAAVIKQQLKADSRTNLEEAATLPTIDCLPSRIKVPDTVTSPTNLAPITEKEFEIARRKQLEKKLVNDKLKKEQEKKNKKLKL